MFDSNLACSKQDIPFAQEHKDDTSSWWDLKTSWGNFLPVEGCQIYTVDGFTTLALILKL